MSESERTAARAAHLDDAFSVDEMRTWRRELVQGVLRVLSGVGLLAAGVGTYYSYVSGDLWFIPIYWVVYGLILLITFWRHVPYAIQAGFIVSIFYGLAILDFFQDGRGGSGRVFLLVVPFAAGFLFGRRAGLYTLGLILLTMVGMGWAITTGQITGYQEIDSTDPIGWVSNTAVLMLLGAFIVASNNYLIPRLSAALGRSRRLTEDLEQHQAQLEKEVSERTAALARRSIQLETGTDVARESAAIRDVERLLKHVVDLISERFGFYHTGIFLLDESGEYAVLRAASSEGGQRMLMRGHRLKVGETGIVGYVTARGEPRISLDVGEDAAYFDNPDLPQTRSEVTLPLHARGQTIGALDVQSTEPAAFTSEDATVLQGLADLIALAISNARLFERAEESLRAERRAFGDLSLQAWLEMVRTNPDLSQRYDPHGIFTDDGRRREVEEAVRRQTTVVSQHGRGPVLATPLKVRDRVIGVIDAHKPPDAGGWRSEEIALMEMLVDQLGTALESARLYQDTQRRATREQLTRQMTEEMQRATDVDDLVQSTIRQLYQALSASRLVVHMGTEDELRTRFDQQRPDSPTNGPDQGI